MMKHLVVAAAVLMLSTAAEAQTVCVILNGATTAVLGVTSCDPTSNPPSTTLDVTDARWTAWLLLQAQKQKQAALDTYLNANEDIPAFIRAGTLTTTTGTQVGAFLAATSNHYRTLRAAIAAATTTAAVNAIDITAGWPANP